jgi:hypothetical protein
MPHFPQPNPAKRATRIKLGSSVVVSVRSEGDLLVLGKLHELSTTGGLVALSKALEQGDLVEVEFQTSQGKVHGMAEFLYPRCESASGCFQPFRFVALEDLDHTRLRMAMASFLDQTLAGVASTKRPTF